LAWNCSRKRRRPARGQNDGPGGGPHCPARSEPRPPVDSILWSPITRVGVLSVFGVKIGKIKSPPLLGTPFDVAESPIPSQKNRHSRITGRAAAAIAPPQKTPR
jgi:hypothetical protein